MARAHILAHDDDLHVRLGGRHGPGPKVGLPSLGRTPGAGPVGVKAVVKVAYMRAGRVRGYTAYIERDGTAGPARDGTTAAQGYSKYIGREGAGEDGRRAELFTRIGSTVDREAFVTRSHGDPRAWTIIVAPSSNALDLTRFAREFVTQLELDLHLKLDYLAAVHKNSRHHHFHILMRGKDREGHPFKIPREYIRSGMRTRATEIAQLFHARGVVRETPTIGQHLLTGLHRTLESWMTHHAREGRGR